MSIEMIKSTIKTIETRRENLVAMSTSGDAAGYVVKCGPMFIRMESGKPVACGVESATRYNTNAEAGRVAAKLRNGAADAGVVVRCGEAIAEEIGNAAATLRFLREGLAKLG
jgi:hypothetical protein